MYLIMFIKAVPRQHVIIATIVPGLFRTARVKRGFEEGKKNSTLARIYVPNGDYFSMKNTRPCHIFVTFPKAGGSTREGG